MNLFKGIYYFTLICVLYSCNNKSTQDKSNEYQQPIYKIDTKNEKAISDYHFQINEQIQKLEDYDFFNAEFDLDSLMNILDSNLSLYLKKARYNIDSSSKLSALYSDDSILCIYSYSYNSGGTRGLISRSVVQWLKKDGTFGIKFLDIEPEYYESFKLKSNLNGNLYLFLGSHKGDGLHVIAYAQFFQLVNDTLRIDYPGFYNQFPYIIYADDTYSPEDNPCIACIDYNPASQLLTIENLSDEDQIYDPKFNALKYNKRLKLFKVKFNGQYFQ